MVKLKLILVKILFFFIFIGIYKSFFFLNCKMMFCFIGYYVSFVCVVGYDICRD